MTAPPLQARREAVTTRETPGANPAQESLYAFPYHHLVDFDVASGEGFHAGRWYPGGLRYAAYMLHVLQALGQHEFRSLIDIGCGDGWLSSRLARRFPERSIVGVDVSPGALGLARSLARAPNLSFLECNVLESMPAGGPFDCGTLVEVLEHIPLPDVDAFVRGVGRSIKPGGQLFVTVPSTKLPRERIARHHQHFTAETLSAALAPCFEVQTISYVNRRGRAERWLRRLLSNSAFALTHERALDFLFRQYMRHLFHADASSGLRVFGVFRRLPTG